MNGEKQERSLREKTLVERKNPSLDHSAKREHHTLDQEPLSADVYCLLFKEFEEDNLWASVASFHPSLKHLQMIVVDDDGRNHTVDIGIPDQYPTAPPSVSVAFPRPFVLSWRSHDSSLFHSHSLFVFSFFLPSHSMTWTEKAHQGIKTVITQVKKAAQSYEPLWRQLDSIDKHCVVLEPERPTLATFHRRIKLPEGCSLHISLDIEDPLRFPVCNFFGSDRVTGPLRSLLHSKVSLW